MPVTYDSIARTTLGTQTSTITFSSISNAFTDLRLIFNGTVTGAGTIYLRFNGDSGSNYSYTSIGSNGSSVTSSNSVNEIGIDFGNWFNGNAASSPIFTQIDIFNYTSAQNKSCFVYMCNDRNNANAGLPSPSAGLWRNTNAINSVSVVNQSQLFSSGTTVSLYGILRA